MGAERKWKWCQRLPWRQQVTQSNINLSSSPLIPGRERAPLARGVWTRADRERGRG